MQGHTLGLDRVHLVATEVEGTEETLARHVIGQIFLKSVCHVSSTVGRILPARVDTVATESVRLVGLHSRTGKDT